MTRYELEVEEVIVTDEIVPMCDFSIITSNDDERYFITNGIVTANSTVDEVELLEWEVLQEAFSMTMEKNGHRAIDILSSTRKKIGGTMDKLLERAKEMNFKIYTWCIWDIIEECKLPGTCEQCVVFSKCKGRARSGRGYYKIRDFIKKVALLDDTTFVAQWECGKPMSTGAFYPDFDRAKHVISFEKFCERIGKEEYVSNAYFRYQNGERDLYDIIPDTWEWVIAFDWGYTNPTVWVQCVYDKTNDIIYVVNEYYEKFREPVDHSHYFIGMRPDSNEHNMWVRDNRLYDFSKKKYWYMDADPANPEYIRAFARKDMRPTWDTRNEQQGIFLNKCINDQEFGWSEVRKRLALIGGRPRLMILDHCTHTIREHEILHRKKENDETPDPVDDHTCDAVRYVCAKLSLIQLKSLKRGTTGSVRVVGMED
jgi:hypothetical protein